MNQITANHPTFGKIDRVNKTRARKLFNEGKTVLVICCNFWPTGLGGEFLATAEPALLAKEGWDFDKFVKNYEYYNCVNSETGTRAAYYSFSQDGCGNPS